ncbi:hypothetical protein Tco_0001436 [Tanacetum coccineum]
MNDEESPSLLTKWIEELQLPNGLRVPPHVEYYDGKGDPNDFIYAFEEADQDTLSFVHGVKIKSLVKFISTELPESYDGLIDKVYSLLQGEETAFEGRPVVFMDNNT